MSSVGSSVVTVGTALWDLGEKDVQDWCLSVMLPADGAGGSKDKAKDKEKETVLKRLVQNLITTIKALMEANPAQTEEAEKQAAAASANPPPAKRARRGRKKPTETASAAPDVYDQYQIWVGLSDEVPGVVGAVLTQVTVSGMVNAISGQVGGIVDSKMVPHNHLGLEDFVATAGITYKQIRDQARTLHRYVQTRVEADFLATTPARIQTMLCPELEPQEFKAVRKRVYETVYEGKGRNVGAAEQEGDDVPVAARSKGGQHEIEKDKKCPNCGNNDQSDFVMDRRNGDIICQNCGTVVSESLMHEGSQFRKFEGEVDRNHHGDAPNKLYSNAHNMSTSLGGVQVMGAAGGGGFGTQSRGMENILRNTNTFIELNISQFGKGERKTRIGYKDRQKKDAFVNMTHVGDALHLHEAVVQRAKELFAGFRDDRELVQQFKGVIAACLCVAFDQFSKEGLQLMKQRQAQESEALLNSRATKRNALHAASMAGKGGLLLDMRKVETKEEESGGTSALEQKPVPTWDLDDCRSWLLEASRNIATQWMEDRKTGDKSIPDGTQEELEGKLVEHTITLVDLLEQEIKSKKSKAGMSRSALQTPRVKMGHLGIKWQHKHERGSGGKGGVGGSGRDVNGKKPGEHAGRRAGQLLILKSKKFGSMIKDTVAGGAFHRELRKLIGRQDARKRKDLRDEATRHRFQQMKRKPWLQAKALEATAP